MHHPDRFSCDLPQNSTEKLDTERRDQFGSGRFPRTTGLPQAAGNAETLRPDLPRHVERYPATAAGAV